MQGKHWTAGFMSRVKTSAAQAALMFHASQLRMWPSGQANG